MGDKYYEKIIKQNKAERILESGVYLVAKDQQGDQRSWNRIRQRKDVRDKVREVTGSQIT